MVFFKDMYRDNIESIIDKHIQSLGDLDNEFPYLTLTTKDKLTLEEQESYYRNLLNEVIEFENTYKNQIKQHKQIYNINSILTYQGSTIKEKSKIYNKTENLLRIIKESISNKNLGISEELLESFFKDLDGRVLYNFTNQNFNIDSKIQEFKKEVENKYNMISNGVQGEKRVDKELNQYKDFFTILPNIRLEVYNNSIETDFIILSENGLFSLEVKNLAENGSYQLHITSDGQWVKVLPNGKRIPYTDITLQVNRHILFKDKFVNEQLSKVYKTNEKVEFNPIVVISNEQVMIQNDSNLEIVRASQIPNIIKKYSETYSTDTIDKIKNILISNNKPPKEYEIETFREEIAELNSFIQDKGIQQAKIMHILGLTLYEIRYSSLSKSLLGFK